MSAQVVPRSGHRVLRDVLAFARQTGDEDILEIEVDVASSGATVDAPGELAAPVDYADMDDVSKQIQLAEFIAKGIEESDLEFYYYALDETDRMLDLSYGETKLDMKAMRGSNAAGLPFRYYDMLWANPGTRRVRVILRDQELGRISSVTTEPTTVPHHADGAIAVAGPVGVDWDPPGLMMRGFSADTPPAHKEGGPVEYPFVVGANEVTPAAVLAGPPGSVHHAYLVAHNLGLDAQGSPQAGVMLALQSPAGEFIQLAGQEMVATSYDEWTSGMQMLTKATLPSSLPSGFYDLLFLIQDQIKGERVQASLPIWVDGQ